MRSSFENFTNDKKDEKKWTRRSDTNCTVREFGYTNFMSYVQNAHQNEYTELLRTYGNEAFTTLTSSNVTRLAGFFVHKAC